MSEGTELITIDSAPVSTAVVPTSTHAPAVGRVGGDLDMMQIATACAMSGFFKGVTNASQAIVKMKAGREMGIGPIMSLSVIHIIEGRPTASATVLAAKVKTSGRYDYRPIQRDKQACILEWTDRGQVLGRSEWTMEDARAAGLSTKTNWKSHPRAMLFANALKEGMRVYCPEICCGIYATEELAPDLEITEDGHVSAEAWQKFLTAQQTSDSETKEKPMSAMEAMRKAAEAAGQPAPPAGQQGVVVNSAGAAQVIGGVTNPPYSKATDNGFPSTTAQEAQIRTYLRSVNSPVEVLSIEKFRGILASYGASKIGELTTAAADDVIAKLGAIVARRGMASLQASQAAASAQLREVPLDPNALATPELRESIRKEFDRIGADDALLLKYLGLVGKQNFREFTVAEACKLLEHLKAKPTPVPN